MSAQTTDISALLARAEAITSDAERVTTATLRRISLPTGVGTDTIGFGLITLDNGEDHTRPNTFGARSLLGLNAAIHEALADDSIDAIGVTGKPFILAAGADLTTIAASGPDGVRIVAELGHAVFRKLREGGKPSFGFINGLALGGGLEVALHCTYRTVLDTAAAVGLPEVMLGLVPGWGGAWLVPNLVGADKAITLILENPLNQGRTLSGKQAYEFGLADACFSGVDYLERSLLWAGQVLSGAVTVERPAIDRGEAYDAALARGRAIADAKTGGRSPAAYLALELIAAARTCDATTGFASEDDALE
ncbi:MAG: enoyl-CoA hydratase/isomerase family protein, partial [Nocardioides sp.]